jgi:hypothetical protein
MPRLLASLIAILLCSGLGLASWTLFLRPAPQWEYQTVSLSSEGNERTGLDAVKFASIQWEANTVAAMGTEGWELVDTYLELETAYPNFGDEDYVTGIQPNVRPQALTLIFKRPIK